MKHRNDKALDLLAKAATVSLALASGGVARAQSPTADSPAPVAFEPRQNASSSRPALPVATTWGAYAIETHKRIEKHLKAHREAFKHRHDLYIELWIDPNGRVIRTRVTGATGNRALDALGGPDFPPGLMLPPPARDMPQPIKLKINADR